jgi:hypothetical protein
MAMAEKISGDDIPVPAAKKYAPGKKPESTASQ